MPVSEKKRRSNDAYNAKCDVIQIRPIKPGGARRSGRRAGLRRACKATSWRPAPTGMRREGQPLEVNAPNDPDPLP